MIFSLTFLFGLYVCCLLICNLINFEKMTGDGRRMVGLVSKLTDCKTPSIFAEQVRTNFLMPGFSSEMDSGTGFQPMLI